MITIKKMHETDITVEGDKVVISQVQNYSSNTIEIPVFIWDHFCSLVSLEINNPFPVKL